MVGPMFPMLNTKSQGHRSCGSEEDEVMGFYHIYTGVVAI